MAGPSVGEPWAVGPWTTLGPQRLQKQRPLLILLGPSSDTVAVLAPPPQPPPPPPGCRKPVLLGKAGRGARTLTLMASTMAPWGQAAIRAGVSGVTRSASRPAGASEEDPGSPGQGSLRLPTQEAASDGRDHPKFRAGWAGWAVRPGGRREGRGQQAPRAT